MEKLEEAPLLPEDDSNGELQLTSTTSSISRRMVFVTFFTFLGVAGIAQFKSKYNNNHNVESTSLSSEDDDGNTAVNVLVRSYTTSDACENDGAGLTGTFRNISFITGKCAAYTGYDDTQAVGSVTEPGYYKASCDDDVLTIYSYGTTDSDCSGETTTSFSYTAGEDSCQSNDALDGDSDTGYTRYYVGHCDGSNAQDVLTDWLAYDSKHSLDEELDVMLRAAEKSRKLYHQVGQDLGLIPSQRAIDHAKKIFNKMKDVQEDKLHPLVKKMSVSPYTWEFVIRTHEGTKDARDEYKSNDEVNMKSDISSIQESWKSTWMQLQDEKNSRGTETVVSLPHMSDLDSSSSAVVNKKEEKEESGEEMWFWDDWFGLAGDDVAENLEDDKDIEDWDDEEYSSMPAITLHVGFSSQLLFIIATATVDIAINTDLLYSVGATVGAGTSTDWFAAEIEYTSSCTFMYDICDNPGDSISYGLAVGVAYSFVSVDLTIATIWADPSYDLLGIDFAFDTGVDLTGLASIDIAAEMMWCTTSMPFNARDVRSYCNPREYDQEVEKEAPWAISNWDDDLWGWNGRRSLEMNSPEQDFRAQVYKKAQKLIAPPPPQIV